MAINRDAYKSLVESVNEATSMSASSKGGVSRVRGGRAATTSNTQSGQLQWGSPAIGGAMNATELAQWLASQSAGMSPNDDSNTVSSQRSGKMTNANTLGVSDGSERIGSSRNATNYTMRSTPAGVKKFTLPYATDAAGVVSGSRVGSFAQSTGSAKKSSPVAAGMRAAGMSPNDNSWGGAGVYGAKNAEDLARILNQMQNSGPSATTGASKGRPKSRKSTISNRKSGTSGTSVSTPSSKSPMVSVADVQEALDILAEAQWASGEALSYQLNRMQNAGPSATTGASKGGVRSRSNPLSNRRPGSGVTTPKAPKPLTLGTGGVSAMSEDEEWDILDEILAEGLELYGEEGLEEILADFAETGEMSEELADLLGE